jgi:hypothetical protein
MRHLHFMLLLLTALLLGGAGPGAPREAGAVDSLSVAPVRTSACSEDTTGDWALISEEGAPSPRVNHTAVWTGQEMIIWGGGLALSRLVNDGGRYDPASDSWQPISLVDAPSARELHTAVWTGQEMIIWGGRGTDSEILNEGSRYDPRTDTWQHLSVENAPGPRVDHQAVWTGQEMIIWGGRGRGGVPLLTDGARYDPQSDQWNPLPILDREWAGDTLSWTGTELVVWGDTQYPSLLPGPGARWDPWSDSWTVIASIGAPRVRINAQAVWTGSELLVWGGENGMSVSPPMRSGGRYDPLEDRWESLSLDGSPTGRFSPSAVWTGQEMIIWGGGEWVSSRDLAAAQSDGAAYHADLQSWRPVPSAPVSARMLHTAVWTGSEMIVWGGRAP